jgi:hypothetical protein
MKATVRYSLRIGLAACALLALLSSSCTPMAQLAAMTNQPRDNAADPGGTNPLGLLDAPSHLTIGGALTLYWRWPDGSADTTNNTGNYQYFSLDVSNSSNGPWTTINSNIAIAMNATYQYSPLAVGNYYRLAHNNGAVQVNGFYSETIYCP